MVIDKYNSIVINDKVPASTNQAMIYTNPLYNMAAISQYYIMDFFFVYNLHMTCYRVGGF
jgi:hypothetical protein